MDNKVTVTIKAIIHLLILILVLNIIQEFFPIIKNIKWYFYIIAFLLVILAHINNVFTIFKKTKLKKIKLFNIYYINYSKVFEICMLINNERKETEESTYKNEYTNRYNIDSGGLIKNQALDITPKVSKENSNTKTYEYKELQKIINTNSTYLSEIIDVCKNINDSNIKNGDLVKIDNIKLEIINKSEIAQINSMISGVFNGNKIPTDSDGQSFNIDVNAITNILLKDYKYNLKGKTNDSKEFYISIPIKAEKEFENNYSIYDLEIGKVNIIGVYRTNDYTYDETSTFGYLQKIGNENITTTILGDELIKSNFHSKEKTKDKAKKVLEKHYIDLIAIVQDLQIKGENDNE